MTAMSSSPSTTVGEGNNMVGNDHQKWSEMPVCPRHLTLSNCILRFNDHLSWSADPTTLFISGNEELLAVA
eukprot:scaffold906_cov186-Alexandrium_tamarense.AAC.5